MSSILKALKKLDDDLPRKRKTVIWSSGSASRKTLRRLDIGSGRSATVLWALLAIAIVVVAGGLYLYLKPGPNGHSEMTGAVTRPISKPDPTVSAAKPAPEPPPVVPAPPQPKTAAPKPAPAPAPQPQPAATAAKPVPPLPAERTPAPPPRRPPQAEKKAARPSVPATPSLPVLTSDLKLQAISWAPAAGDRLAVINGNIVREGVSLEGYVIVQINREEVKVRKGAEQWRLVFDLK